MKIQRNGKSSRGLYLSDLIDFVNALDFNGQKPRQMLLEALASRYKGKPAGISVREWINSILWRFGNE